MISRSQLQRATLQAHIAPLCLSEPRRPPLQVHTQANLSSLRRQRSVPVVPHAEATPSAGSRTARSNDYIKVAEHDLSDYCSNLYEEDGDEVERCWLALNFLEERLEDSEAACEIEIKDGVVNGVDCNQLDKFQDFVRELVSQGNVSNMVKTLAVLAGAEKRKREAALASSDADSSPSPVTQPGEISQLAADSVPGTPAADALRSHLADIFERYDADHNGRLDVQEFREAMKALGDELSAASVTTIFKSLNINGWVSLQQFCDIVSAEEIRAHSRFSKGLRSMARGSSTWWSDIPSAIDQLL